MVSKLHPYILSVGFCWPPAPCPRNKQDKSIEQPTLKNPIQENVEDLNLRSDLLAARAKFNGFNKYLGCSILIFTRIHNFLEYFMLKNKPCAYCGREDLRRTNGHVLSSNIFPNDMPSVQRITVSECIECKSLWEDAELQFRNILLSVWNSDALPTDSRSGAMLRSFDCVDGNRRAKELLSTIKSTTRGVDVIYPSEDVSFNLILRRIVRGLASKHNIGHAIPDSFVTCDDVPWGIPPAFEQEFRWHIVAPNFFRYTYTQDLDASIHSFWLLQFSQHLLFSGLVAKVPGTVLP